MIAKKTMPDHGKAAVILQAATRLFLKHGYSSTTMDAIASHARLTKQTVYSYFKNKDVLFKQMITSLCEGQAFSAASKAEQDTPPETILFHMGMDLLNLMTSPDVLAATRLVIAESDRHPKLAKLYYESGTQRLVQVVSDFLDEQNRRGVFSISNTLSAASYFLSMLKGQYYLRMILRIKPTPSPALKAAHVRESVKVFLQIYGGKNSFPTQSML